MLIELQPTVRDRVGPHPCREALSIVPTTSEKLTDLERNPNEVAGVGHDSRWRA